MAVYYGARPIFEEARKYILLLLLSNYGRRFQRSWLLELRAQLFMVKSWIIIQNLELQFSLFNKLIPKLLRLENTELTNITLQMFSLEFIPKMSNKE